MDKDDDDLFFNDGLLLPDKPIGATATFSADLAMGMEGASSVGPEICTLEELIRFSEDIEGGQERIEKKEKEEEEDMLNLSVKVETEEITMMTDLSSPMSELRSRLEVQHGSAISGYPFFLEGCPIMDTDALSDICVQAEGKVTVRDSVHLIL